MSVFHRNLFIGQVVARSAYRCIWGQSPPGTVKIHARRFVQRSQSSPPSERKSIPVGGLASLADTRESLPSDVAKFVAGYPSVVNISVQWGDQDAFAHVNNVTYIKYMEAARRVYFDQIVRPHMDHQAFDEIMDGNAIGLKTESLSCKYRSPCTYPDTVTVAVRSLLRKDGASQKYIIVSHSQQRIVAEGECSLECVDFRKHQKVQLPDDFLRAWETGESCEHGRALSDRPMLSQRSNLNHRLAEKMPHKLVRNYRAQSLRDIVQFRPAVGVLIQAYRASLRDQSDYTNNAYRHAWDCFTKLYELSKQDVFRSDLSSGLRQRDFGKLMVATNAQPERFLTQEEKVSRIEAIHEHMRVLGFDVDEFAWCQLAIASGWLSTRSSSLAFLERLERAGVRSTYGTYWAILDQLMQGLRRSPGGTHSNATTPADVVFFLEHMKDAGISPDVKIYTFVYQSLNETGHGGFALKILKLMRQEGVQPSVVTYTSIVESCIRSGNLDQVHHVLKEMSHVGIPRDARFLTAFLKVCVKAADIPRAEELLLNAQAEWSHRTDKSESDRMAIKCMYSFIIAAHAKQKNMERAWDWYQHMRKYDIDVDVIALTPLIVGFVHDGQLERAKKLYEELKTIGAPDLRAHSEMLVAYLKMGEMEEANAILQTLADGDLPMGATVLAQLLQFHISRDAEEAAMTFLSTHQSKYSAEELRTVFLNVVTHLVSLGKTESISTWFKRFYPDATDADVSSSILKWYEETKNAEAGLDFFTAVSPSVLTEDGTIAFVRLHRSEDFDLPPIDSLPVRSSRVHAAYLAVLCFRGRAEQAVDLLSTYALDLDLHGYAELATELRQLGMFENARAIEEHARNAGADVSILGNR